jgi:Fibronectin type III domain.
LQTFYKFNEGSGTVAYDSSDSGNAGTIYGPTWTTGKIGSGLEFNGTDNYVSIPRLNRNQISIAAWFYKFANDTSNADAIFDAWRWNSDVQLCEGFDLRFHQNNPDQIQFIVVTQDQYGIRTQKTAQLGLGNSVGSWIHVVGTYDRWTGDQKLYINGELADTQSHPAWNTIVPLTSHYDMRIGHSRVNNGYFKGKIDEVRLYDSVLSNNEVMDIYGNGLVGYWKFGEGNGITVADSSGKGNAGTIYGPTWTTGKIGSGLEFNGTDNYVSIPRLNRNKISIAAWFYKLANDTSNADAIFGAWSWNSDVQLREGFDLRFHQNNPDLIQFTVVTQNQYGLRTQKTAQLDLGNSVGSWIHVVGTYDRWTGDQKLYINGELADTQSHPAWNTIVPLTSYPDMRIGHSRVNNGYFNGKIDEVQLYNRALSNNEVDGLYNKAAVTVRWNQNTEEDLAGYRLYYGHSSRDYIFSDTVGNLTSYTLNDLNKNLTYFIAVTAVDNSGNESDYSQELILW